MADTPIFQTDSPGLASAPQLGAEAFAEHACRALRERLQRAFDRCYDRLFDAAFGSDSDTVREANLATLRELKTQQHDIIDRFCAEVELRFAAPGAVVPIALGVVAPVDVTDRCETEESLAMLVARAETRWHEQSLALERLLGTEESGRERDRPLAPSALINAFLRASASLDWEDANRSLLLDAFDRELLQRLDHVYRTLGIGTLRAAEPLRVSGLNKLARSIAGVQYSSPAASTQEQSADRQPDSSTADDAQDVSRLVQRFRSNGLKLPMLAAHAEQSQEGERRPLPLLTGGLALVCMALAGYLFGARGADAPAIAATVASEAAEAAVLAEPEADQVLRFDASGKAIPGDNSSDPGLRQAEVSAVVDSVELDESAGPPVVDERKPTDLDPGADAVAYVPVEESVPDSVSPDVLATRDPELELLLRRAYLAIDELRLTQPRSDSAYENFLAVLQRDPGNQQALLGIEEVVQTYVGLARVSLARGDAELSARYVDRALEVRPHDPTLLRLRSQLR